MTAKVDSGFTLAEMLVVLAIVALAAAIAFPSLKAGQTERSLLLLSQRIASALLESRMNAVVKNRITSIEFDTISRTFKMNSKPFAALPSSFTAELLTGRGEVFVSDPTYTFFPDGSSTGGSIRLIGSNISRTIKLHWLTGQVELEASRSEE
jgi:general secretion pathway protein H